MRRLLLILALALGLAAGGAESAGWKVRVVQLDLARQMETVPFIKRYLAFAKESGFTTVQLYLEGRIRTASFPWRRADESYSPEQVREIVAEADRLGLDLVPVVSVLAHAEHFVNCSELDALCEESRAGRGRFRGRMLKQTFCHAVPETRAFLERYLSDVIALFPGKNVHVGLDESFNTGFCPACAAKMRDPAVGLGGLYLDTIRWAHGFLASRGRRMWLWGDFFEFFPERVSELPRDVVVCDWEYSSDISANRGHYGTFGDRYRHDWIRTFGALGIETLACPASGKRPMTRFSDYAQSAGAAGGCFLLWEMAESFHARRLVRARATGLRWSRGLDALDYDASVREAVRGLCPTLGERERAAVRTLVDDTPGAGRDLALEVLRGKGEGPLASDPFSEAAIVDDLVTEASVQSVAVRLAEAERSAEGLYRRPSAIRAAKSQARVLRTEAERLLERRVAQEAAWRPGCRPNGLDRPVRALIARADRLLVREERPAADDEWQLELALVMPDYHGVPAWTVRGRFDGTWREIARGNWKPAPDEWCYYERTVAFQSAAAPDALRIDYTGYNDAGLAHLSVANVRRGRFVPTRVTAVQGRVKDAGKLLEDTVEAAYFGNPDCRAQILDPALAEETSSVTVLLAPAP